MPNSNNNQQSSSGSGFKTAATLGLGAAIGALAAGAAWYFSSDGEQRNRQHEVYRTSHPVNRPFQPEPETKDDSETDEKDGTIKMCEVCFISFDELKLGGIQIVSTPCGHVYCRDCIIGALQVKPECPHCRSSVQVANLRRLYL
ncbi:E3 ubiquitin-protein ligase RNF4 [Orchesella cincta]|uniref:E3 ubiquitin-protein ligase RNF4 n=1 Tax=Orchesella cincta TaxID=48709 RepID=A0A1D2N0Y8_ORCCI|nr:E3 ubiquitin-protein ligase RNF4 [Orchesella cincta]